MKKFTKNLCYYGLFLTVSVVSCAYMASPLKSGFYLYPDSTYKEGPLNPQIPFIPPEAGGVTGKQLPVEKHMLFHLKPFVDISQGATITFFARDNKRRIEKKILEIRNKKHAVVFGISPASGGRLPELKLQDISGKRPRTISKVRLKKTLSSNWQAVTLTLNQKNVTVKINHNTKTIPITDGIPASELIVMAWHVDDLTLKGNGHLVLDWDSGYAVRITPKQDCKAVQTRLFGFDTMMITPDPNKRENPKIQLINGSDKPVVRTYQFNIKSEINKLHANWLQTVKINANCSTMQEIKLPFKLKTDIYHLYVTSEGQTNSFKADKHFMYVERRNEPAGPNKFALHNYSCSVLGDYTETLPIGKVIRYNRWGYIVGPAWIKDWNGKYGLNPDTPPEEWNWQRDTDIAIKAGITTSICLCSQPLLDWQRTKVYDKKLMGKLAWGLRGGKTNAKKYRGFVHALAERYKGKVKEYEVENEPNASHCGLLAEDYTPVLRAVYEEVKAVDPDAKIYGICGTGDFLPYMKKVFKDGGYKYMDGVSWHTYTSPKLPDDVGLYGFLQKANQIIKHTHKPMLRRNTETGIYTARRFEVDKPISPKRVQQLIDQGVEPFVTKTAWWRHVLNEWDAATSLISNVTYNFLAGAKDYTFFGWAPAPARLPHASAADIFSNTLDKKKQTPNLHSLAAGVMTAQYEGMIPGTGKLIDKLGVRGGMFNKKNKGKMAVLWAPKDKKNIFIECADSKLEVISAFGRKLTPALTQSGNKRFYNLKVGKLPVYIHSKTDMRLVAPFSEIKVSELPDLTTSGQLPRKQYNVSFRIINFYAKKWSDTIAFKGFSKSCFKTKKIAFSLKPGETALIKNILVLPAISRRKRFVWKISCMNPNGKKIRNYEGIDVKPGIVAVKLRDNITFPEMLKLDLPGKMINKIDQCQVGRPPKLASLQEEQYWKGPDESSAKVNIGYNAAGIKILIQVTDKNAKVSGNEISCAYSCVELFLDFRKPGKGLGDPAYQHGVYQYLIKPAIKPGQKAIMKNCSSVYSPDIKGAILAGGPVNKDHYWIGLTIPWSALALTQAPKTYIFGVDIAVDAPFPDKEKRKTQMVLFGTAENYRAANKFGQCVIFNTK